MPIVLNIGSEKGLVHIDWPSRRRIVQCDGGGLVLKKSSQGGESKTSVGTGSRELIILHMFPSKPELQRVSAASEKRVVIELVGIPSEDVFRNDAQRSVHSGDTWHYKFWRKASGDRAEARILGKRIDGTHRCGHQSSHTIKTHARRIHE